ncbi:winged helix-turn-helix transcriptional regulator [Permianibacter sp. IMCC34836]|uniref:winged helix-turn-helix domain-containing protein n=1 Tax=Permianibacter fluminis TaxID=2738515 RepID=UPI0015522D90|nr:winged helix-turn-helix domain-containing protein [Permianibacter fluminis]NQD37037.1 winged helix-turn-helix transcriptional regulator [Permianibacter fluminis]
MSTPIPMTTRGASNEAAGLAFGRWQLQPALCRIRTGTQEWQLEPRVMQVLAALVRANGEPVTRDALMQAVWGKEVVSEDALNRTVSRLRKVLSEELDCPALLETIPKVGYRLSLNEQAEPTPPLPAVATAEATETVAAAVDSRTSATPHPVRPTRQWLMASTIAALLGYVGWQQLSNNAGMMPEPATDYGSARITPFTTLPGREVSASFSPDGSQVAFTWLAPESKNGDIQVRTLGSETLHPVAATAANEQRPAWSPDGRRIAYFAVTDEHCEIRLVSPQGGPSRKLIDCPVHNWDNLTWRPDGRELVFTDESGGLVAVNVDSAARQMLTAPKPTDQEDGDASFSSDGSKLAFSRWRAAGVADVYVLELSSGALQRLTGDNVKIHGIAWEPDGEHLVFASNRAGPFALWRIASTGGAPSRVPVSGRSTDFPAIARTGAMIYEEGSGQANLFAAPVNQPETPARALTFDTRWDWQPVLAPNGERLAFVSDRSGTTEIWLAKPDGSELLQLSHFNGPFTNGPAWSPDSSQLALDAPPAGNTDIYLLDASGGNPKRITSDPAEDRFANWSRDGTRLYFASFRTGDWQIWQHQLGTGEETQLTRDGGYIAREAADGNLYFSHPSEPGLWLLNRDDRSRSLVLPEVELAFCNSWQLYNDGIAYVKDRADGGTQLQHYSLRTRRDRWLRPLPRLTYKSGLSITPTGEVLYSEVLRSEADLMLVLPPAG